MVRSILVPLDGSELAERILEHVGRLLEASAVEVILLRVVPDEDLEAIEEARRYLQRIARLLGSEGTSARIVLRSGDPAAEILAVATEERPSLVVMATHGRSGPWRWLRGSVAERVLRGCPVPLLLSNPRGYDDPDPGFPRILLPLDGSARSASIVPLVTRFAAAFESEVTLLHVMHEGAAAPASDPEGILSAVAARLEAAGIATTRRLVRGDPADELLAAAEDASLVMMTTHGWSGVERWLFGSVAEKVLRSCARPLVIQRVLEASPGEA